MNNKLTRMMSVALLLGSLSLVSCGNKNDDENGERVMQPEIPDSTVSEAQARQKGDYTLLCRPADEIQGGNYQYFWSVPRPGEIRMISLDLESDLLEIDYQSREENFNSFYQVIKPDQAAARIDASFSMGPYEMIFPTVPRGTIRGSRREYVVGLLRSGDQWQKPFLCPLSIEAEFEVNQER